MMTMMTMMMITMIAKMRKIGKNMLELLTKQLRQPPLCIWHRGHKAQIAHLLKAYVHCDDDHDNDDNDDD